MGSCFGVSLKDATVLSFDKGFAISFGLYLRFVKTKSVETNKF